jgi:hypothetical protein
MDLPFLPWRLLNRACPPQDSKGVVAHHRDTLLHAVAGVLYEVQKRNLSLEQEVVSVAFARRGTALVPVGDGAPVGAVAGED